MKKIRGHIPPDLGLLTDLTYLSLWNNQLSGTIPSSLVALTALTELYLNKNQLVGTMPFCDSNDSDHQVVFEELDADCAKVDCPCCTNCLLPNGVIMDTQRPSYASY